jgi:hypothetical protein
MLIYGLLACSSFDAQPCELRLLHAAIKGGKVTKAGEQASGRVTMIVCCSELLMRGSGQQTLRWTPRPVLRLHGRHASCH